MSSGSILIFRISFSFDSWLRFPVWIRRNNSPRQISGILNYCMMLELRSTSVRGARDGAACQWQAFSTDRVEDENCVRGARATQQRSNPHHKLGAKGTFDPNIIVSKAYEKLSQEEPFMLLTIILTLLFCALVTAAMAVRQSPCGIPQGRVCLRSECYSTSEGAA